MGVRIRVGLMALLATALVGGKCFGGSGGGGGRSTVSREPQINTPDQRCAALGGQFPPGLDLLPGSDRLWVADLSPAGLVPFDVGGDTLEIPAVPGPFGLPADSDGDGRDEGSLVLPIAPILDDVSIVSSGLALVTASSYEEVLFFDPVAGGLRPFDVSVPASFLQADNPLLPAPGDTESRTGLSTFACVVPAPGTPDSRGDPFEDSLVPAAFCRAGIGSYLSSFTSGAAIAGDRLFVATSNLGDDPGEENTQYLPGSVLVYDIDPDPNDPTVSPNEDAPVILTTGFNPTQLTSFEVGSRSFVLVTVSGALGIVDDDPGTDEIEGFGLALSEAAVDVIDADTLELVATIPLGLAGVASSGFEVDPGGRVAVAGSVIEGQLYAVDLSPLEALPGNVVDPVVLDGSDGDDAVIFDAADPFEIPPLPDGAPEASCPGFTADVAWNGDRLYATESCDGALAVVDVDFSGSPPAPLPADRFTYVESLKIAAAIRADTLAEARAPGALVVRPGAPMGPNVFFLIGQEGAVCGIEVE